MTNFNTAVSQLLARLLMICFFVLPFSAAGAVELESEFTYGAEYEFFVPGSQDFDVVDPRTTEEKKAQMRFVEHMRERCLIADCTVMEVPGKWKEDADYKVEYSDGWWFKISYDPSCVEITFKPSTLKTLEQKATFINDQIFKNANEIKLYVKPGENTHFNIGARSAFGDDPIQFLRFFVDYANHPDLALGSLGQDISNGPPLSVLGIEQRSALQEVIEKTMNKDYKGIWNVANGILSKVYTQTYSQDRGAKHNQALGIKYLEKTPFYLNHDAPMELRAVWIQSSQNEFNLIARLIEGRIKYLKKIKTPIVYTASDRTTFSPSELLTRFFIYVEEVGLKYKDFKELIPRPIQQAELADFMKGSNLKNPSIEKRIKSLNEYFDLIPISPLYNKKVIELLTHLESYNLIAAKDFLERIRTTSQTAGPNEVRVYQRLLTFIEKKREAQHRAAQAVSAESKSSLRTDPLSHFFDHLFCPRVFD